MNELGTYYLIAGIFVGYLLRSMFDATERRADFAHERIRELEKTVESRFEQLEGPGDPPAEPVTA